MIEIKQYLERFREFLKEYKYFRKGALIGLIVGIVDFVVLAITSMTGFSFMTYVNYPHFKYIYPVIENGINYFYQGEGRIVIMLIITIFIIPVYFVIVGGGVGLIIDKFKK